MQRKGFLTLLRSDSLGQQFECIIWKPAETLSSLPSLLSKNIREAELSNAASKPLLVAQYPE